MIYETRILSMIVAPEGNAIFCREATKIRIEDDAGGEFVVVEQVGDAGQDDYGGKLAISPADWPEIREAIDKLIAECRG